jgi:hypothetical protein
MGKRQRRRVGSSSRVGVRIVGSGVGSGSRVGVGSGVGRVGIGNGVGNRVG